MLRGASKISTGVMGGSFGGMVSALMLKELGHHVRVLERSPHPLVGRGLGIALPPAAIKQCIDLNLFNPTIPCFEISSRSFFTKDSASPNNMRKIWQQPMSLIPFNWSHIYSNLRQRLPDEIYHVNQEVVAFTQDSNRCYVETSDSSVHEFDGIIAADGVGSFLRRQSFPDISAQYAGYAAWRGIIDAPNIVNHPLFCEQGCLFVFATGHLVAYQIPAHDYETSKEKRLNWALFDNSNAFSLSEFLTDKDGKQQSVSLPSGSLSEKHVRHLHALAREVLPEQVAEFICQTKMSNLQLQPIFDYQLPSYINGNVSFVGDSGACIKPHAASGALRAIEGGISLARAMNPAIHADIEASRLAWSREQVVIAHKQCALSTRMAELLVTNPPHWNQVDESAMKKLWDKMISGEKWHALPSAPTDVIFAPPSKQFTPKLEGEIEKLRADFEKVCLDKRELSGYTRPKCS